MPEFDLNLSRLVKYYGFRKVIDDLNIRIGSGEFFTIYGPNGAGKTTLLLILSTLVKPSSGELMIGDLSYTEDRNKIRQITGLVSHSDFLYENLTAYENLTFFGSLYDVHDTSERSLYLLEQMSLYERKDDLVRNYSSGMKKRLSIARSLIHDPEIVLFDEPFAGLDQRAIGKFNYILSWLKEMKRTVIVTTHNIKYSIDLSDRVGIMERGRIENIQARGDNFEQRVENIYRNLCEF